MEATAGVRPARPAAEAEDLQIAGLVPLSTLDWPGKLSAVVFCQGCPWDCGYCQNAEIRDCDMPGIVEWSDVLALLGRRHGLLDGVVFSGGEATRQNSLGPAMAETREMGFGVALHTAGAYPRRLAGLLPLLDWVGLDIKALPEDYGRVVGAPLGGVKAWDSLDVLLEAGIDHEVRLTVHPNSPQAATAVEIARMVRERGTTTFALQNARVEGTRAAFHRLASVWDKEAWKLEFDRLAEEISNLGWETFEAR